MKLGIPQKGPSLKGQFVILEDIHLNGRVIGLIGPEEGTIAPPLHLFEQTLHRSSG